MSKIISSDWLLMCLLLSSGPLLRAEPLAAVPARAIQDNSFFIEEAYNQEAGVVQHIFATSWLVDERRGQDERDLTTTFTQEWPLFSQTHQVSYTVPYTFDLETEDGSVSGLGDVMLNYRFQLWTETETRPAFAPRLSVILPTGDEDEGLGDDTVGLQVNLPFSKVVGERWTFHANAGATFLADVEDENLWGFNLGASAIYAVSSDFNLMLEVLGTWDEGIDGSDTDWSFAALVSPGARYALNLKNDLQVVVGVAAPIGVSGDGPDYGVFFYLSIEHPFGRR